jgi:Uma2 family endonuclease
MSIAVREVLTLEQFLRLPEIKPPLEFLQGRVEQKVSPTLPHGAVTTDLASAINQHARPRRLGRAFVEVRCSFGGESFVPDLCFFTRGRVPKDSRGQLVEKIFQAPDLAVEVISPGQTLVKLTARLDRCLRKGVRLAWLIQPRMRRVFVFHLSQPRQTLELGDMLPGEDVLPGFALPLDEMFGWLVAED